MSDNLLDITNITKVFRIGGIVLGTRLVAVDDVSLSLESQQATILSVVGESGSGKTTLARMILKLVNPSDGDIRIDGKSLFDPRARNKLTDREFMLTVQPIFQNPFETFSMRKRVDSYLFDTAVNLGIARNHRAARDVVAEELDSVGLNIETVAGKYPNQFSGGELQRISVARALIPRPKLIVADEPVSMIDASLRMNIVNLFLKLKETHQVSFIYITHDLSTAYYVSDYIAIMYRGQVVEYGPSRAILTEPAHPYTELLMDSVPKVGEKWSDDITAPDVEIKEYGATACKFANRCAFAQPICREHAPPMVEIPPGRQALCYRPVDYQPNVTQADAPRPRVHA
jgi:peptide/nickel transport system ATP-binding protein